MSQNNQLLSHLWVVCDINFTIFLLGRERRSRRSRERSRSRSRGRRRYSDERAGRSRSRSRRRRDREQDDDDEERQDFFFEFYINAIVVYSLLSNFLLSPIAYFPQLRPRPLCYIVLKV